MKKRKTRTMKLPEEPLEEADDFSVGQNGGQLVHMESDDKDDVASGDEGVDDGYEP
jgi:hypothetical protein